MKNLSSVTLVAFQTHTTEEIFNIPSSIKSPRNLSGFIKNVFFMCVLKMNDSLKGLEQHDGDQMMTILISG